MQTPVQLRKLHLAHHHINCSIQPRKNVACFDKSYFLLHHVDGWVCVHCLPLGERMPECTMGRGQANGDSVMLWAVFCWETLDPAMDVTLTRTTYLNIVADQVHSFIETLFINCSGFFQQDNTPCHTAKWSRSDVRNKTTSSRCWLCFHSSPEFNSIELLWNVLNKTINLATSMTYRICCLHQGARYHSTPSEVSEQLATGGPTQYQAGVNNVMADQCTMVCWYCKRTRYNCWMLSKLGHAFN